LHCLAEATKSGKDETSQIEILWDVVLTLFDSFIHIGYSFIEIIFVEVKNCTVIVKSRNMIIGKLWQMCNTDAQILNSFLKVVTSVCWISFFLKVVLDDLESEIQIRLGFVWNEFDCLIYRLSWIFRKILVYFHYELIIVFGEIIGRPAKLLA